MEKNALVSVKSFSDIDENEVIEVVTPGKFTENDYYYEVIYEESKLSGMDGTTTVIKIYKDVLILERIGTTETKMEFEKGEIGVSLYKTPYGILNLTIETRELDIEIGQSGGKIYCKYILGTEGQPGITTQLTIKVRVTE